MNSPSGAAQGTARGISHAVSLPGRAIGVLGCGSRLANPFGSSVAAAGVRSEARWIQVTLRMLRTGRTIGLPSAHRSTPISLISCIRCSSMACASSGLETLTDPCSGAAASASSTSARRNRLSRGAISGLQVRRARVCPRHAATSCAKKTILERFSVRSLPGHLRCGVCDLELDGEDQLHGAEIDRRCDIDIDPGDFYDGWD